MSENTHLSALSSLASLLCNITILPALKPFDRKAAFALHPLDDSPEGSRRDSPT